MYAISNRHHDEIINSLMELLETKNKTTMNAREADKVRRLSNLIRKLKSATPTERR